MLTTRKTVNIVGTSKVDDTVAERYTAVIEETNPESMSITQTQVNKTLAKSGRDTCNEDFAAFKEAAYALQDEMIAESAENETEEETD